MVVGFSDKQFLKVGSFPLGRKLSSSTGGPSGCRDARRGKLNRWVRRPRLSHFWSLTWFYSVDFSKSRIGVKSAFSTNAQSRFATVAIVLILEFACQSNIMSTHTYLDHLSRYNLQRWCDRCERSELSIDVFGQSGVSTRPWWRVSTPKFRD